GTVTNLAARLCSEARDGQILVTQRVLDGVLGEVDSAQVGPLELKGISRAVDVHEIFGVQETEVAP
ncbi:MAG TPA: adenylate/guanylate cyclase domain-containing response regulator, partial [Ornithinibacter sp.]|nr:adenylate/guanylate cyclase domain-containing response regulator [Ornithinibacter sp.]